MEYIKFKNKRVLVRVDFNVPIDGNGVITDDTRMQKALPTLRYILDKGGRIILLSHLGRPPKSADEDRSAFSLAPVARHLAKLMEVDVQFCGDCIGDEAVSAVRELKTGEILVLENTRFYEEETKGDEAFAAELASYADIYINDAFGTAHRAHASTTIVAQHFDKKHKGFGFLMSAEIENADKVLKSPKRPLTAIVGGAKVSDKIQLLDRLLDNVEYLIVGGGMAYTFIKAQGGTIGNSLCENDYLDLATELIEKAKKRGVELLLPEDSVVADKFAPDANSKVVNSDEIEEGWMGLDIGPVARSAFARVIMKSKTILWNGPMGVFEMEKFAQGTLDTAHAVADATAAGAFSLIGGGDSVAAINQSGLADKVSFISTGGGAMLEYLEGKVLPGVEAILE